MTGKSVRDFFQSYSDDFNSLYDSQRLLQNSMLNRLFRRSMHLRMVRTFQLCLPIVGKSVLDVGCGSGQYSIEFAKRGACRVVGIDFAPRMIQLARKNAEAVAESCEFYATDLFEFPVDQQFDYAVAMGFMDYVDDPKMTVTKILSLTRHSAVLSFPVRHGFLAWQRKIRYQQKCHLVLYDQEQVLDLFKSHTDFLIDCISLGRDYFVSATRRSEI